MSNRNNVDVGSVLFQDTMDASRFVRIVEEKKTSVVCKVWFGKDKNNLYYHGTAELPKSLFDFDGRSRVGFNPARDPVAPVPNMFRDHQGRNHRNRRDDYEYEDEAA